MLSGYFPVSQKSQVDTIDEEVFEDAQEELAPPSPAPDTTDKSSRDDPERPGDQKDVGLSDAVSSSLRSVASSSGSGRTGASSSPQLQLMLGFLRVRLLGIS